MHIFYGNTTQLTFLFRNDHLFSYNRATSETNRGKAFCTMNIQVTRDLLSAALSADVTVAGSGRCFLRLTENNSIFTLLKGRKSSTRLRRHSGDGDDICVEGNS